jgi:hypothetical protein
MGSTAKKRSARDIAELYDRDFVLWTEEMARLLRERRFGELDIENLAEKVESMGKRDRREVVSRLEVLLMHLIKRRIQPDRRGAPGNPRSMYSGADCDLYWRIRPASVERCQGIFHVPTRAQSRAYS